MWSCFSKKISHFVGNGGLFNKQSERKRRAQSTLDIFSFAHTGYSILSESRQHQWEMLNADVVRAHQKRKNNLDLSHHAVWAVDDLTEKAANLLSPDLKNLTLPVVAKEPRWVGNLHSLQKLNIPEYQGKILSLSGRDLKEVNVPLKVRVENRQVVEQKTKINHIKDGVVIDSSSPLGQIYFAQKESKYRYFSINNKFNSFVNSEKIDCGKISFQYLLNIQKIDAEKDYQLKMKNSVEIRKAKEVIKLFGSKKIISNNKEISSRARYDECVASAPERAIVNHAQWGKFIADEFKKFEAPGRAYFLASSASHALVMSLRAKPTKDESNGSSAYVVELYDPNLTTNHRRTLELDSSQFEKLCAQDLIPPFHDEYYNPEERWPLNGPVTTFIKMPLDAYCRSPDEPIFKEASRKPWKIYLDDSDTNMPMLLKCLYNSNSTIEEICCPQLRFSEAIINFAEKFEGGHDKAYDFIYARLAKTGLVGVKNLEKIILMGNDNNSTELVMRSLLVYWEWLVKGKLKCSPKKAINKLMALVSKITFSPSEAMEMLSAITHKAEEFEEISPTLSHEERNFRRFFVHYTYREMAAWSSGIVKNMENILEL